MQSLTTIVRISTFADRRPLFEDNDDQMKFYAALGRMVYYAMNGTVDAERDLRVVDLSIDGRDGEMTGVYHAALPAANVARQPHTWYDGLAAQLDLAINVLVERAKALHRPFIVGAIRRSEPDGEGGTRRYWSYHS